MNTKKLIAVAAVAASAIFPSFAATYYKVGNDAKGTSSFAGNVSSTVGWAATSGASATTSFSALEMTNSTFIVGSGTLLRTPADSTSDTFGGKVLRLEGNGMDSIMSLKGADNSTVTIPHLVSQNGCIFAGDTDRSYTLKGKIDIVSGYGLYLCGHDSGTRTMYVDAAICGDATTKLVFPQNNTGTGTQVLHINNAADFFGEATVTATSYGPTKLYINGPFGGSVGTLGAKLSMLVVNYDGLPADKGLRCTAASVPAPLKTVLTLYSATADFGQHHLPLITFPAGTVIDPAEFTVKHATTRDGTAETFPLLTTYTAGDGSVVLAVDASYPTTARLVGGAWQFYGSDGRDVTATCGLTTPTAEITVLIGSTDELAAVRAAGVTPKGYRLTADFDVTGATDLTDFAGFEIEPGYAIDLKGNSLKLPSSMMFGDKAFTVTSSVAGGEVVIDVPSGTSRNTSMALTGSLKVTKKGAGTFVSAKAQTYTDGTDVEAGTVRPPDSPADNNDTYSGDNFAAFGTGMVNVLPGAVFDVRGNYGYTNICLKGGTIANTLREMSQTAKPGVFIASLADADVSHFNMYLSGSSKFDTSYGKAGFTTDLGGKTLEIIEWGSLCLRSALTNGTLRVVESNGWFRFESALDMRTTTFDCKVALQVNANVELGEYIQRKDTKYILGSSKMTVHRRFCPISSTYFYGCTLVGGCTFDLSQRETLFTTSCTNHENKVYSVAYEDNATIKVKLGERKVRNGTKIVSWTTKPTNNVKFVAADGERKRSFVIRDDGLYVYTGFVIIVE